MVERMKEHLWVTHAMITLPFPITRANNPPTIPALAPPTGQPNRPQNGHTDELAYIPEKMSHQVRNFNKQPINGTDKISSSQREFLAAGVIMH